ncbi:hypothetical protein TRICI_004599 [Trichomonascus ciferrii]|uniref:Reverse transcriptase Ty1/copia-type domain-containing protein n=1 Tax=Trichomonascus ciferrii TaxID=44093 RepID=A0A642UZX1_9ASCO|nr:hypothetical protein TRICI_004599 [Trichomonascus ciferrii]
MAASIDELLIPGNDEKRVSDFKVLIEDAFNAKDFGPVKKFLGHELQRDVEQRTLRVLGRRYIRKMLHELGIENITQQYQRTVIFSMVFLGCCWKRNTRHDCISGGHAPDPLGRLRRVLGQGTIGKVNNSVNTRNVHRVYRHDIGFAVATLPCHMSKSIATHVDVLQTFWILDSNGGF